MYINYPMGYNFSNYPTQPFRQPYVQQPQQPMGQPQSQTQYELPIQYMGYANQNQVEAYILPPNSKALFKDNVNGVYYEKTCNNDGVSSIKQFKDITVKSENKPLETEKEQPSIDLSGYAKKEELGAFVSVKQYNELVERVEQLQKQVTLPKTIVKQQIGVKNE